MELSIFHRMQWPVQEHIAAKLCMTQIGIIDRYDKPSLPCRVNVLLTVLVSGWLEFCGGLLIMVMLMK